MNSDLFIELENDEHVKTSLNALDSYLNNTQEMKTFKENSLDVKDIKLGQIFPTKLPSLDFSKVTSFFSLKPIQAPIITELKTLKLEEEKMDHADSLVQQGTIRETKVARFGRIYKRKVPSKLGYQCLQKIEGFQYCKFCNANLPLEAFYVSTKRYVCRRHHYLRVRKRINELMAEHKYVEYATRAWFWLNSKRFFLGYDKIRYDLGDLKNLLKHAMEILPFHELKPLVVPIDFTNVMRPRNIALVSKEAAYYILRFLEFMPSKPLYVALVQHLNLFPKNFDVGFPDNPRHDPNYIRQDIDIKSLFDDPYYQEHFECHDKDIVLEFLQKSQTPWYKCKMLPAGEAGYWKDGKPICSSVTLSEQQ